MSAGLQLERVRRRVAEDPALGTTADVPPALATVRSAVARAVRQEGVLLPPDELARLVREVTDALAGLGPAQPLLRDPAVTDVLVNGPDEVWVERDGRLERTTVRFADAAAVHAAALRTLAPLGLRLDRGRPWVDARLPDGSRLHALLPPLAPGGPVISVRRFAAVNHTWEALERSGAVPVEAATLLRQAVAARRALVCCGRTGTGKTTLLNLLLAEVSDDERVLIIEDAPELRPRCRHVVRLESRPPNAEGAGEVTIRDLVRQALRMRPDRIVVGEVRGVEVVDMLQALATGHEGCMTTVHARAADEALVRLEGMALLAGLPLSAARAQLAVGLDLLAVLSRGPDGRRGLVQIAQVQPRDGDGPLRVRQLWQRESWT
ncbi:MAG: Flp pilus assembly complex ATPase component TadA [Euzebyaceae bacterium]|nr:Flp pilus assembly complex ATPase component TadA [Euzebyaceae bacterium]